MRSERKQEARSFIVGSDSVRTLAVTLGVMDTLEKVIVLHVDYRFSCSVN